MFSNIFSWEDVADDTWYYDVTLKRDIYEFAAGSKFYAVSFDHYKGVLKFYLGSPVVSNPVATFTVQPIIIKG